MTNNNQLQDLYRDGAYPFTPDLKNLPIAIGVKAFLLKNGFPLTTSTNNTLGIRFISDASQMTIVTIEKVNYWKIADEWEENKNILAIRQDTEEVYVVTLTEPGKAIFVNSNLNAFLLTLQYFKQYAQRKEVVDPPPMTLSRQEMLEKLAMLKNGTLPVKAPNSKTNGFNQRKAFEAMHHFIQQTDSLALQNNDCWWSLILEQVKDGIL